MQSVRPVQRNPATTGVTQGRLAPMPPSGYHPRPMECLLTAPDAPADEAPPPPRPESRAPHCLAFLLLGGLFAWQGWMTLALFGPVETAWERLLDDRPVVSGRHPLHLYHG